MTPVDPTDEQLAAWLAGDLTDPDDAAVTEAVRHDPAVAARADALSLALTRLDVATGEAPAAGFDTRLGAALAATLGLDAIPPAASAASPAPTQPGEGVGGPAARPRPVWASGGGAPRTHRARPGLRRLDRLVPGLAVVLLLTVVTTIGLRAFRDGPLPVPQVDGSEQTTTDELDEPAAADDLASALAQGDDEAPTDNPTDDELAASSAPTDPEPTDPDPTDGTAGSATTGEGAASGSAGTGTSDSPTSADTADEAAAATAAPAPPPGEQPADDQPADDQAADDQPATEAPATGEGQDGAGQDTGGQGGGPDEGDDAAAPPEDDGSGQPSEESADAAPEDGSADDSPQATTTSSPTIADSQADLPDTAAVDRYFGDRPESGAVLGLSGQDAADRAADHAEQVRQAGPFPSGERPDRCLDTALQGSATAVVVAVETVIHDGQPGLAYLVVRGDPLDRADVTIVPAGSCQPLLVRSVPT